MNNKGFAGLIGLLLAVAIVAFVAYIMFKQYFQNPTGMDQRTQQIANQAGIDTTSQAGAIDSARSLVNSLNDSQRVQDEQIANALGH